MKLKNMLIEMTLYNPNPETLEMGYSNWVASWKYTTDPSSIKDGIPQYGFFRIEGVKTDPKDTYPSILSTISREHITAFKAELKKFLDFQGIVYTGVAGTQHSISVTYVSTDN